MNVARVLTNETCNQHCAFCNARRPEERTAVAGSAAVRQRMDDALAAGARELVFTGGEPTLRADLEKIAAYARGRGAQGITLETNAALIDDARAAALAAAGVTRARVHTPAWGDAADAITQDPGGFAAARAGMDALAGAGVALELSVPIVRANAELVEQIPQRAAQSGLAIETVIVVIPIGAPDPDTLLSVGEAAAIAEQLARRCRDVGIAARFDVNSFVPPCVFPHPGRVAHMFSMTRGGAERTGYGRDATCETCQVADRCPGAPEGVDLERTPVREDRMRRRLSIISSVQDQIARELVTIEMTRAPGGETVETHTVRVNFHCNQSCQFCFVSTHLPPAEHEAVREAIVTCASRGARLSLSGGEPTLNPRLAEYVQMGADGGAREIELQSNAIHLGDRERVRALERAGLTDALVSLHGSTAEISDAITDAPGTFDLTVVGIDALAASAVRTRLNFVFCEANRTDFPDYVDMVVKRWPRIVLTISFVASSTDVVPRTRAMMPRYGDILPALSEGLRKARESGLRVSGFESMCGLPLCLVPDDLARFFDLAAIPEGADQGEFLKPEPCRSCALSERCFGIRTGYAALHGYAELRPVSRD